MWEIRGIDPRLSSPKVSSLLLLVLVPARAFHLPEELRKVYHDGGSIVTSLFFPFEEEGRCDDMPLLHRRVAIR